MLGKMRRSPTSNPRKRGVIARKSHLIITSPPAPYSASSPIPVPKTLANCCWTHGASTGRGARSPLKGRRPIHRESWYICLLYYLLDTSTAPSRTCVPQILRKSNGQCGERER